MSKSGTHPLPRGGTDLTLTAPVSDFAWFVQNRGDKVNDTNNSSVRETLGRKHGSPDSSNLHV